MSKLLKVTINDDAIYRPAMAGIAEAFHKYGHEPSNDHWGGISEIVKAIEGMAVGVHNREEARTAYPEFTNKFYISSLPPGMGKTSALIETVKAIMRMPQGLTIEGKPTDYSHISFIIFLSRLSEIEALVERMDLDEADYSVIVNPKSEEGKKVNALGNQNKKAARVLFTTQQMLETRCHDKNRLRNFSDIADFYYEGRPRDVRVWDEAILPSRILTMELDQLMALPSELIKINADLADTVRTFCFELGSAVDGSLVDVPDLTPYEELLGSFETLQGLHCLTGKAVRVARDNRKKTTTLQYADIMPDDIKPLLILDASGEQRATYELWKQWRKDLVFLHSPGKSYQGLTVHHWDRGSARNTLNVKKKEWQEIVDGVVAAIEAIPRDEQVLVIHLIPDKYSVDLEEKIKLQLPNAKRVQFLTWGRHTATNAFKDFKHVILTSLWYYAPAAYEAQILAAKKQDIAVPATKEEKKFSEEGEHRHHVLQAACRGKVRYAKGDRCPDGCHLYLIYSTMQGLGKEDFIQRIFPKCQYEQWRPLWKLTGLKAKIADFIRDHKGHFVSINGLCRHLDQRRDNVLRYLKSADDEVQAFLKVKYDIDLTYHQTKDKDTGFLISRGVRKPF